MVALAALATVAGATVPAATGAEPKSADELRRAAVRHAAQQRSAELELYAIETRLAANRSKLEHLRAHASQVGRRHTAARRSVSLAELQLDVADRLLAERLLALYEQGEIDPLAVLFGAESLDQAIDGLEGLSTLAAQDSRLAAQARGWKQRARAESRRLAREVAALRHAEHAAAAHAAVLEGEVAARHTYLAELRERRQLTARQIAAAEAKARAAERNARALIPAAAPADVAAAPEPETTALAAPVVPGRDAANPTPPAGSRTLIVVASGYALPGRTATGIKVGWGVVAVDPAVIPLGTRLAIPGYGEGVAADIGSAIRGARIDLWFPTRAQAVAWGVRTVTVTVY